MNRRFLWLVALAALAGCNSGRYPVTGKVTYQDGSPVTAGTVIGEATVDGKLVAVQGNIGSDGSFQWGGAAPGDGALPGNYRVLLTSPTLSDFEMSQGKRPGIVGKYGSFDSSGITVDVIPGKNDIAIKIDKPS